MVLEVREQWLAQVQEEILEPERRIVDPHHHFFVQSEDFPHYTLSDLWADTATHRVEQTVFLQCWEGYRETGPEQLMPVGETEWVESIANEAAKDPAAAQIGAIVGTANLCLGAAVREVLEAHVQASERFRGIRLAAAFDDSDAIMSMPGLDNAELYADANFQAGFAVLADMGLSFDAYHYHHQTPGLTALARKFPQVPIVLDHLGTPLGVGPYAGKRAEIFPRWAADLSELASCPNVTVKLGGLAMPWNGFGYDDDAVPPSSEQWVADQAAYYHHAIEQFGPERSMFESNFPVDKCAMSYAVLWNGFKLLAKDYSESDKDWLFRGTASRVYKLADKAI